MTAAGRCIFYFYNMSIDRPESGKFLTLACYIWRKKMNKIGILTCIHSNNVCARVGCLAAFQNRTDFFQDYPEDTCLAAMMTCNGCKGANPIEPIEDKGILEKMDRLVSEKISAIHVGVCRLPDGKHECPRMTQICNMIEERGIKVIRGTHKE